jgi:hypothetical protein
VEATTDGSIEAAVDILLAPVEKDPEPTKAEDEEAPPTEEGSDEPGDDGEDQETESDDEGADEDDDDQEGDDQEEEPSGRLYTVKVDGQEVKVTLDDLKRGYSGQQYVQQGMQEAAKARKQAEEVYHSLAQERQRVAQLVQHIQQGGIPAQPVPPPAEMFQTDPIGYMEQRLRYDAEAEQFNRQMGELNRLAQQQSQADAEAQRAYIQGELRALRALEPDFGDPEKAAKVRDELLSVGEKVYGYSPEEIASVTDHRALRVLRDAARYRKLVEGKEGSREKQKAPQPMARKGVKKPINTNQSRRRKQAERLRESGSIEDAVGLILR